MSEPAWSLPMNRRELIERCERFEAALRKIESNNMSYDLTACAQIARKALGLTAETPAEPCKHFQSGPFCMLCGAPMPPQPETGAKHD